jgi:hypothetical protein
MCGCNLHVGAKCSRHIGSLEANSDKQITGNPCRVNDKYIYVLTDRWGIAITMIID